MVEVLTDKLWRKWLALTIKFDKADICGMDKVWNWIEGAYTEPNRHYHTLSHLDFCLEELNWHHSSYSEEAIDLIEFALFFHDIIYDTRRNDNEQQSAKLAREAIKILKIRDPIFQSKVVHLIQRTKHVGHTETLIEEEGLFLDLDLAILGADDLVYDQFEENIRKEYEWVPWEIYCQKRVEVLRKFLEADDIFHTPAMKLNFEIQALSNLDRTIDKLTELSAISQRW